MKILKRVEKAILPSFSIKGSFYKGGYGGRGEAPNPRGKGSSSYNFF
jgi:hypothetical protein